MLNQELTITSATVEDLPAVEYLFRVPNLQFTNGEYYKVNELKSYIDPKFFLVAKIKQQIVGAIMGEPLKCYGSLVQSFAVNPSMQHQGIGIQLLNTFEQNMREVGRKWIVLYAPANDSQTLKFYQRGSFTSGHHYIEHLKIL